MRRFMMVAVVLLALLLLRPAQAEGLKVDGYLGFQGPVGFSPEHVSERSNEALGGVSISRLPLRMRLDVDVRHSLWDEIPTWGESRARTTLWCPVDKSQKLWLFAFYENRYRLDEAQVVVGARYNFSILK